LVCNRLANNENSFSVELKSRDHVKSISLSDNRRESVIFEGVLGRLEKLGILEGAVLLIKGANGSLMVDLPEGDLRDLFAGKKETD
jgi:hypothetical protein